MASTGESSVNVAAPFLEDGAGGRSVAMGENYTAIADGPFGMAYNPAGLAAASTLALGFQHETTGEFVQREVLAGSFRLGPGGMGVLINSYSYGSIEARDGNGQLTGETINPGDLQLAVGYGLPVAPALEAGANIGFYREDLGTTAFSGVVLDVGGRWTGLKDLTVAVAIKNIGSGPAGYSLPASLRAGCAYPLFNDRLLLAVDLDLSLASSASEAGLGLEYCAWNWLDLRTGFQVPLGEQAAEGLVLGAGFNVGHFGIDLSLLGRADFGAEVSLSLMYNLDGPRSRLSQKPPVKKAGEEKTGELKQEQQRLATSGQDQAKYHFQAGQEYEKYGQTIDAIIEYKAALKIWPEYKEAQKALVAAKEKARAQAEKKEEESRADDGKSASIQKLIRKYYNMGLQAYTQKDYATAIKQLQLVLELTTQHREATELLEKARHALNSEMSALKRQAGRAKENGDLAGEVEAYQKMLDLDPDNKRVKAQLDEAQARIPKEVDRLYKQGVDFYARSLFRKSLESFETLLRLQPDHVKARDAVRNIKEKLIQTGQ
ncbi:PorV/PorQ family protein [candidate division FCPU426 bacterium]|nr:PorV/PorQ family protein [candidate division FCPU426 bacterium]